MELLDDVHIEVEQKPIFSIIALVLFLAFIASLYYIGEYIVQNGENALLDDEFSIFILSVTIFLTGLVSSIVSLVKKEKPLFLKMIGVVIYGFILAALILSLLL